MIYNILEIQAHHKKIKEDKEKGIIHILYTPFLNTLVYEHEVDFFNYICMYYCCHCTGWRIGEKEQSITLEQLEANLFESLTPDIIEQLTKLGREGIWNEINKFDHWLSQDRVRLSRLVYITKKLFTTIGLEY